MKAFNFIGWISVASGILILVSAVIQALFGKALVSFYSETPTFFLVAILCFIISTTLLVCLSNVPGKKG